MLISSNIPSKPREGVTLLDSMLKRLRKVNWAEAVVIAMLGEISSVLPTVVGSGANVALGAVSTGVVVTLPQGDSLPVAAVVQPAGSPGAATPSKFWEKPSTGVPVGRVKLWVVSASSLLSMSTG